MVTHKINVSIFILALLALPASLFAGDRITVLTPDGHTQQFIGSIIEETYEYIEMEVEGDVRKIPLVREGERFVTDVRRRRFPSIFARGLGEVQNRNFEAAFNRFRESAQEGEVSDDPWLAAYLRYYAGHAAYMHAEYASWEDEHKKQWFSDAALRYERLLEETPKHRFAPYAALELARAQTKSGEFDKARQVFSDIAASDYPFWVKDEAEVWKGYLLVRYGNYEEAMELLTELFEKHQDGDSSELAYRARLFQGYAAAGLDNDAEAEDIYQEVGLRSPDNEMRAVAWNKRGLSLYARGRQREALLSFLRVSVMHPDIRNEAQMALYYAAQASEEYYGSDDRAAELREKLRRRFPNSYWAERL